MSTLKENKLAQVDELIIKLGLTRDEEVDYFAQSPLVKDDKKSCFKISIERVKAGMFWYEDDTFSFERIADKKIKAIVELVRNGIIYGDLTASELFDISEKYMDWFKAQRFFKEFSYPCKENEKIVWCDKSMFDEIYDAYSPVKKAFEELHKPYRSGEYWSATGYTDYFAWYLNFNDGYRRNPNLKDGHRGKVSKYYYKYVRPTIALKVS